VDARTRNLFVVALVALIALVGGAALLLGDGGGQAPSAPPGIGSIEGVVVGVRAEGLDDVRGFTLRTADGTTVDFTLGALENAVQFPPGHLVEHQSTAQAVRVWFRTEGGAKVAIRLEDAS